jgi:RimJ/RimL family protein N-acetyltransferase
VYRNIFLSLFCDHDVDRLFEIQSDKISARMRKARMIAESPVQVKDWLVSRSNLQSPTNFCLAVREVDTQEILGYVTLKIFDSDSTIGELGIVLHFQKREGLGSLALNLLEEFSKKQFGYQKLVAQVSLENSAGKAFFEKNGYNEVSETKECIVFQKDL